MDNETIRLLLLVEQALHMWTGRHTYDNDLEWLENIDGMMSEVAEEMGIAFRPMIDKHGLINPEK